jgi:hypothetical protein
LVVRRYENTSQLEDKGVFPMANRTWKKESLVRLDSLMVAYYISLRGIPIVGAKIELPMDTMPTLFPDEQRVYKAEMEISNAFFLQLKGLIESRLKDSGFKANWKTLEEFIPSVGLRSEEIDDSDKRMLSQLCALRNCLAHKYGLVDEEAKKKIPELEIGRYIFMDRQVLKNWFIHSKRIFELVKPKG